MRPRALVPSLLNNVIDVTCSAALIVMCIPGQVVGIVVGILDDIASEADDEEMMLFFAILTFVMLQAVLTWREWVQDRLAYLAERMEVKRERVRARVSDAQEWMSAKKESALSAAAGFQWNTAHRAEADEPSAVTRKSERWRDRAARVLGSAFRNSARAAGEAAAPPTTDLEGEPPTNAEAPKTRFFGLDDALHPAANAEGDTQQQQVGEP